MLNLTLNGRQVTAQHGETIIEVARREGVYIPTLCYQPGIEPYSVCRLCLVEVSDGRRTRMVTACSFPLTTDGLKVETDTEQVLRNRRLVLELLLARCPESKPLADFAAAHGVTHTRFIPGDPQEMCILCGLCERVCEHAVHVGAISRAQRGIHRRITPPFGDPPAACTGCAACAFVCPTGAVQVATRGDRVQIAPWGSDVALASCSVCGKPFAPQIAITRAAEQLGINPEYLHICFECRQQGHSGSLARLLAALRQRQERDAASAAARVGLDDRQRHS